MAVATFEVGGGQLMLHSYCTHAALIPHSYTTHTPSYWTHAHSYSIDTALIPHSYYTHIPLMLHAYCTHTACTLHSYPTSSKSFRDMDVYCIACPLHSVHVALSPSLVRQWWGSIHHSTSSSHCPVHTFSYWCTCRVMWWEGSASYQNRGNDF